MKIIRVKFKYPNLEAEFRVFRVNDDDLHGIDSFDKDSLVELLVDLAELDEVDSDFVKSAEILPLEL